MDKYDVKINFPYASVTVKGRISSGELSTMQMYLREGQIFTVTSTFDALVTINPALVTYIEATPTIQPF